jgi:lysophospholipase L1-like esterase
MSRTMKPQELRPLRILSACSLGSLILGLAAVWLFVIRPERELYEIPLTPPSGTPTDWASDLNVAVVGDSWVANQKLDAPLADSLAAQGIAAEVQSVGFSGAKSRHVAKSWAADGIDQDVDRALAKSAEADYLVLVVGVNDAAGHVGSDRYSHHVDELLQAIERKGLHPVLVELPEFGIEQLPSDSLLSKLKLGLFRLAFDDGQADVIARYRAELQRAIAERIERGQITFVDFDRVCSDYEQSRHLFKDPSHLNERGSEKLAEAIAASIATTHRRRLESSPWTAVGRKPDGMERVE